jgi:imidazolonepropionase
MRELSIIEDGAILANGEIISKIGKRNVVEPLGSHADTVVDAGGRVVLPGFVDAHTHPVFAGSRADEFEMRALGASYQEIAATGGGIKSTVRKTRAATLESLVEAGTKHAEWFIRNGTTTVEAKSGYGLSLKDEVKILRAIAELNRITHLTLVPTFLGAHEVPDEYRDDRDGYIELVIKRMLPEISAQGLAEFCDVFCEETVFTFDESRKILSAAKELGLGIRLHGDQLTPGNAASLAAQLGAITADHLEHTGADGIKALKTAGVQPVLLPGSVYALGHAKYPDARAMIDAGLAIVLATDFNPGSSPTPSMPMVLSIAATHMKMSPAEGITASTINAAYSLNRGEQIGSLEVGKRADLTVFDAADFREVAYFFGIELSHTVIAGGQIAYQR